MATIAAFSICQAKSRSPPSSFLRSSSPRILAGPSSRYLPFGRHYSPAASVSSSNCSSLVREFSTRTRIRSVAEDQTPAPEVEETESQPTTAVDQTVSVPVSPSDVLKMFFQAEGTIDESAIPKVTKALEGTEGVTDLRVQIDEGIASVQLTKETTVQATGVASSLIEIIQGSGFKLQTLNLSFEDEEDVVKVGS